jgi:nitroreductase
MPDTEPEDLPVLDALHSTPSRRYLSTEPIPEEVVWQLLDAAVRGPSGGNTQRCAWVVVTDPDLKRQIAEKYRDSWNRAYGVHRDEILAHASEGEQRVFRSSEHLAEHLQDAPVWIVPVLLGAANAQNPRLGSSIYGAVQQLMLAARAYGIGATLTTLHTAYEDEVRELLGLPEDALTMALIPLGYPAKGRWTQPKRRPLAEVVHFNRYGVQRS